MDPFDVIIIGGGPAGLNAAVVLGRCNRKVLLFDHGKQRNRYSHGMHNYLTRDDIAPKAFLALARKELKKYKVKMINVQVNNAKNIKDLFEITDMDRKKYHAKKLILATGLADILPDIPGTQQFYGKSVYHCPYCDGWECSGKKLAVYSKSKSGTELALTLSRWSNDITLFTDGNKYGTKKDLVLLKTKNINIEYQRIKSFEGKKGQIEYVVMDNGDKYTAEALFFSNGYEVQCDLVESLGCITGKNNVALTNKSQQTNIYGLYVVGDASKDMHFVVVAAAEGAKAAVYINKELLKEEFDDIMKAKRVE